MSEEKRPLWMTSISATIDPEDYLLGRKIDKTFELSQKEKAERARELRINLASNDKLRYIGDPMLDLERRKQELKLELIRNPIKLKQLREKLLKDEREKQGMPTSQSEVVGLQSQPTSVASTSSKLKKESPSRVRRRSPSSGSHLKLEHRHLEPNKQRSLESRSKSRQTSDYSDERMRKYKLNHRDDSSGSSRGDRNSTSSYRDSSRHRHHDSSSRSHSRHRSRSPRRRR